MNQNPTQFLPAEWHKQEAVVLVWPTNFETWPTLLPQVQKTYLSWIQILAPTQAVWLLVNDENTKLVVQNQLRLFSVSHTNVRFFIIPTFDAWVRDFGPLCTLGKTRMAHHFKFNAWGGKYSPLYALDAKAGATLAIQAQIQVKSHDFILEGGSIEVNGKGTLLTSTNCLLNKNRNTHLSLGQIEQYLENQFGIKRIIWVNGELSGDDTNGHIDDAVRFVNESTVVYASEANQSDENYLGLKQLEECLKQVTLANGTPLQSIALPMPAPVYSVDTGERLPASYANFLITNAVVFVPIFNDKNDAVALQILQDCFRSRQVVGLDATALVHGFGALHCLSMQIPAYSNA